MHTKFTYIYKSIYIHIDFCRINSFHHVTAQEQLQEADQAVENAKKMLLEAEAAAAPGMLGWLW